MTGFAGGGGQHNFKLAFTLAEVLITLGIIGIVAAITLPAVVNNVQDRQFRKLWKKSYSDINNAFNNAFAENKLGMPTRGVSNQEMVPYAQEIYYQVFSRLNTKFYCVQASPYDHNCPDENHVQMGRKNLSPDCHSLNDDNIEKACMFAGSGGRAELTNGAVIYAHDYFWEFPAMLVDVNGKQKPNTVGRDMFIVLFRKDRVYPGGSPDYPLKGCDKSISSGSGAVGAAKMSGSGCGFKYLYE